MKNSPLVKIGIGILIALLTGIVGLLFHSAKKQQDFRTAWEIDEATEELQMFAPEEKQETLHHLKVAPTGVDFVRAEVIQEKILSKLDSIGNKLHSTDSIARLGVRLIYEVEQGH